MAAVAPLPMATSVITAATPMIMPSMVRPVRILLRPSALNAIRNVITGDMGLVLSSAASAAAPAAVAAALGETAARESPAALTEWEGCGRGTGFRRQRDIG